MEESGVLLTCEIHNSDSDLFLLLGLASGTVTYLCSDPLLFFLPHSCHSPWQYNQNRHLHSSSPPWDMRSRGPLVAASAMRTWIFYTWHILNRSNEHSLYIQRCLSSRYVSCNNDDSCLHALIQRAV
jgi:hypothetical protein